jgi:hypothetical protein
MAVPLMRFGMPDFGLLKEKLLGKISEKVPSDFVSIVAAHYRVHGEVSLFIRQRTYSERIAARKLAPHPTFAALSDKAEVRHFVEQRAGATHLIPLYAVTSDIDTFDFSVLPSSFAMKATHGSGWVKLVRDSTTTCPEELRAIARSWISQNYHRRYRERQYRSLQPRIIFEKLLLENGEPARDFKVHCFRRDGRLTQIVQVHSGRFENHRVNFFDCNWKPLAVSHGYHSVPEQEVERPAALAAMIDLAKTLSADFNYVRVDLYTVGEQVYFGELTFTPGAGLLRFEPSVIDRDWATLFDRETAGRRKRHGMFGTIRRIMQRALVLPMACLSTASPSDAAGRSLFETLETLPNAEERRGSANRTPVTAIG